MTRRRSTYKWETKVKQTTGIREENGKWRKRNEREEGKGGKWRRKRDMQTEATGQG